VVTRSAASIEDAVAVLRRGGLVAFPTETVYGLGADAANREALQRLFRVKGRPADHPVIVHIAAGARLDDFAHHVPAAARALAAEFWPGPLTIVLPKRSEAVDDAATGGRPTVGLRVPDHPLALELLAAFAGGIAAPSANRFGHVSPTTAQHVRADLGDDVDLVLDGGPCRIGVESTIVDLSGACPLILRVGGIATSEVARVVGHDVEVRDTGEIAAPGTLALHYAPRARVEVVTADRVPERAVTLVTRGERVGVLASAPAPPVAPRVVVLAVPADAEEYARVLYSALRTADAQSLDVVLAVPPAPVGVGVAVCDRLRRASAEGSVHPQ
jgi:L-threonylcarbamoyladenylate synthase